MEERERGQQARTATTMAEGGERVGIGGLRQLLPWTVAVGSSRLAVRRREGLPGRAKASGRRQAGARRWVCTMAICTPWRGLKRVTEGER